MKFFVSVDTCVLILVLNAALHHPSIISILPDYVFRHYRYLRTKEPDLTPNLQIQLTKTFDTDISLPMTIPSSHDVFDRILKLSEQSQDLQLSDRQKFYRNLAVYVWIFFRNFEYHLFSFHSENYIKSLKWILIF